MSDEQTPEEKPYVLRADFMRYVKVTGYRPNGDPIHAAKRYERGDTIMLPDSEAERYLRSGAMVEADKYDPDEVAKQEAERRARADQAMTNMAAQPDHEGQVTGHLVGLEDAAPAPKQEPVTQDGIEVEDVDGLDPEETTEPTSDETGGDYESMDYPQLQQLAKARTGSGAGGKQELIDRLHQHDADK